MRKVRANPYVGLRPFFVDDTLYFFGREQQTAELLEILHQHRFLGIVGSSGSGKSSLVRAGLLPALLAGFLVEERDHWLTMQVRPGDTPLNNFVAGLMQAVDPAVGPDAIAQLEKNIRDGHTDAVIDYLRPRIKSDANLFILVDQFEEIFAFRGAEQEDAPRQTDRAKRVERARRKAQADDFVDLLLSLAAQRDLPIYVALTMRTDFLGDCDLFYGLPEALNQGRYLVPRMNRQQLRDAIECPAILVGAHIAPRLLDNLLNELGDRFDRLPVLQHALLRTWDAWENTGRAGPVEMRHFLAAGGLEGALDQDAENALQGLDAEVTARTFKRLTTTDAAQRRVRSPCRVSQLMAASAADRATIDAILKRFEEDGRSFVHQVDDGCPDDPRVDISHESLIRQWDRLRDWVDEERAARDDYVELVSRAKKHARGEAALLWPPALDFAASWRERVQPTAGWAERYCESAADFDDAMSYLDASLAARRQHQAEVELKRRWDSIWNRALLFVEIVVGVLAFLQLQELGHIKIGLAGADIREPWRILTDTGLWQVFAYVALCMGLNKGLKWVHRRVAFPKILQRLAAASPVQLVEAREPVAETRDAVTVHGASYASTGVRLAAYVLDWFLFSILMIVPIAVLSMFDESADGEELSGALTLAVLVVLCASSWLYLVVPIASKMQASFGMRALNLFRTDNHGGRLSVGQATKWWVYRLFSYSFYGIGFMPQPFTKKRQTLHDLMAKTVVLKRPPQDQEKLDWSRIARWGVAIIVIDLIGLLILGSMLP